MRAIAILVLCSCIVLGSSAAVSAETISVSQTITISARVEDKRSIVVNDKGQITKIYSNTAKDVVPGVYLHDVPGKQLPLTEQLKEQYDTVIAKQDNLVGVEIPVAVPIADESEARNFLTGFVSSLIKPLNY